MRRSNSGPRRRASCSRRARRSGPTTVRWRSSYSVRGSEMASRREEQTFLVVAILIGIYSGLAVVSFRLAIDWIRRTLFGGSLAPTRSRVLLVPALGGLVVATLVVRLFPTVRGSGVNQTKAALYIYDGYI